MKELTFEELCRLRRVFNAAVGLRGAADKRIAEWLEKLIEAARK